MPATFNDDEIMMGPGCSLCGDHRRLTIDPDGMVMCVDDILCMSRVLRWSVMVSDSVSIL